MDDAPALPPQIRGKVRSVLSLFVDEVKIFRNIFFLTDSCDLVVQIQWWGELIPALIRPFQIQSRNKHRKYDDCNTYLHTITYSVKTTLDLFKLYLKDCHVLELVVLAAFETCVIGSAFLRDLLSLINTKSEFILPLINYLGEIIGEIKVCFKFSQVNSISSKKKDCLQDVISHKEKNLFKNGKENLKDCIFHDLQDIFVKDKSIPTDIKISNLPCSESTSLEKNKNKCSVFPTLPEVKIFKDSSIILEFDTKFPSGKLQCKNESKLSCNKKNKPSKQQNRQTKESFSNDFYNKTSNFNKAKQTRVFEVNKLNKMRKSLEISKEIPCKEKSQYYQNKDLINFHLKSQDLKAQILKPQENYSKNISEEKVLNYLLGFEMSKDDEKSALNDLREMSPSHEFVCTINESCRFSDIYLPKLVYESSVLGNKQNSVCSHRMMNKLNFDLNNPIERSYYKKFFVHSKKDRSDDLEIAEILNKCNLDFKEQKQRNKMTLALGSLRTIRKAKSEDDSHEEVEDKNSSSGFDDSPNCQTSTSTDLISSNFTQCNYNKKLEEIKMLVDSLKKLEKRHIKK